MLNTDITVTMKTFSGQPSAPAIQFLEFKLIRKDGKGYRIKHAQILSKLDRKPENRDWTYDRIKDACGLAMGQLQVWQKDL